MTIQVYASEQCLEPEFELTVTVELARPGGMAKRPYVAIWIEDADRRRSPDDRVALRPTFAGW